MFFVVVFLLRCQLSGVLYVYFSDGVHVAFCVVVFSPVCLCRSASGRCIFAVLESFGYLLLLTHLCKSVCIVQRKALCLQPTRHARVCVHVHAVLV